MSAKTSDSVALNSGANPFAQQFPAGAAQRRDVMRPSAQPASGVDRLVNTTMYEHALSKVNRKIFARVFARTIACKHLAIDYCNF